jgi:putative flippase GtrA
MLVMIQKMLGSQFLRYGAVGILNLTLSIIIFNFFLLSFHVTRGPLVSILSLVTFGIVVTHSFLWNKFLVFKSSTSDHRREYTMFFIVSGIVSVINTGIITVLVNVIGPPYGLSAHLWANVALLITIPVAVLCNYFGYKFFVFTKKETDPMPVYENEVI